MPDSTDTVKYDDVDWHIEPASDAGRDDNAFAHMGLYLGWLIRHDLHNRDMFTEEQIRAVKSGSMSGSDLSDNADGKLVSDLMTPDGEAFSRWYYDRYLADFGEAFEGADDYAVADDELSRTLIGAVLDRRFEEWERAGRPGLEPAASADTVPDFGPISITIGGMDLEPTDDERKRFLEAELAYAREQGWQILEPPPPPHEAPELEALIPKDLAPQLDVRSTTARQYRSSTLNRLLKGVGVRAADARVADGIGGRGENTITATIYGVPGVSAEMLGEHVAMLTKQPGMTCEQLTVGDRSVLWCVRPEFILAGWARDEMIVVASAQEDATLERMISRLP